MARIDSKTTNRRSALGFALGAAALVVAPASAEPVTAVERLRRRLISMRVVRFHVSWAPGARGMTAEQRAEAILEMFDANARVVPVADIDGDLERTPVDAFLAPTT